jgi:type IV secretion system protein TrbG
MKTTMNTTMNTRILFALAMAIVAGAASAKSPTQDTSEGAPVPQVAGNVPTAPSTSTGLLPSKAMNVTAETVKSMGENLGHALATDLSNQKEAAKPPLMPTGVLGQEPKLTPKQEAARNISGEWQAAGQPMRGLDGSVVYVFGGGAPEVVCSPLNVCDIELEKGEQVTSNFSIGDSARWLLQFIPGGDTTPPHVAVKPTDIGIETSLMISTDKRTYHLHLISDSKQYTALTKFVYPEEMLAQLGAKKKVQEVQQQKLRIDGYHAGDVLTVDKLDFRYRIDGKASFTPVRVYNDGVHTIIELPEEVRTDVAPVLLVSNRDAPSSAGPTAAVNYRLVNNRFIVDSLFHDAVLVSGVGRRAVVVHISRHAPNPESPSLQGGR